MKRKYLEFFRNKYLKYISNFIEHWPLQQYLSEALLKQNLRNKLNVLTFEHLYLLG